MNKELHQGNDPENAMDSKEKVHSNDSKMKQDFPGYPHNPATEDSLNERMNWRTDTSNESNTTATGSESVRDERPSETENEIKSGSDRGLNMHDADAPQKDTGTN